MRIELGVALALLCLAGAATAQTDKPGGKRICVPSEDGRSWVCGTADAPPPDRGLPASRTTEPSPEPPPFLADPARLATPRIDLTAPASGSAPGFDDGSDAVPDATTSVAEPIVEQAPVPAEAIAEELVSEPVAEPAFEPDAAPVVEVVGADAAEEGTPALLAAPREEPAFPTAAEPEVAADATPPAEPTAEATLADEEPAREPEVAALDGADTVVAEPAVAEPLAAEVAPPAPEPAPIDSPDVATTPTAPEPEPVALQPLAAPPRNTAAFLTQVPTHYTLQVARASSQAGFAALLGTLGLRGEEAFAVPLGVGGTTSWLLLWGDFPDIDSARAAAAQLAPRATAWPRRFAPIQDELRAAGAR